MAATPAQRVEMIPIERITVLNPRARNRRVFDEIVANIAAVGLKRPITVTRRAEADGPFYDLVCGQGRLEACRELGHSEVPALVVSADEEDCLVSSLVENCARRQHHAVDLLQDVGGMKSRGYSPVEIAQKTGLSYEYVLGVIGLLENGEERLLRAVESGMMPISVAVDIANADDRDIQGALQSAYENKLLRGRKLIAARRLVETRRRRGKAMRNEENRPKRPLSSEALVRAYEEETIRKRALIRRSEASKARLTFITEALRTLIDDDAFYSLLEDEGLASLPGNLAQRIPELAAAYLEDRPKEKGVFYPSLGFSIGMETGFTQGDFERYSAQYDKFVEKLPPWFEKLHTLVEQASPMTPIDFQLLNRGSATAEGLTVDFKVSEEWLVFGNEEAAIRHYGMRSGAPTPPLSPRLKKVSEADALGRSLFSRDFGPSAPRDPTAFYWEHHPSAIDHRGSLRCEQFRAKASWRKTIWVYPWGDNRQSASLNLQAHASNLSEPVSTEVQLTAVDVEVHWSDRRVAARLEAAIGSLIRRLFGGEPAYDAANVEAP